MAFVAPGPGDDGEVGDGEVAGDVFGLGEAAVEDAVEAGGFLFVALEAVFAVLFVDGEEVVDLAEHGAEAAHLPHEPFEDGDLAAQVLGQELAGLLAEVE